MLEGVTNLDLSGVGGYIHYTYDNTINVFPSMILAAGIFLFLIILAMAILSWVNGTKSHKYKNFLADMWVAGKIKQLAKKDGIDLEEQVMEFELSLKKEKNKVLSLASKVEEDMKEKVSLEKELEKTKK